MSSRHVFDSLRHKVIVNPAAGSGKPLRKLDSLEYHLNQAGLDYELEFTHQPMDAVGLAQHDAHKGFDVVVAFGGDGTINEIDNGLIGSETALGVIPCGSGNDFARSLRIPHNIRKAVDILKSHQTKIIDLGKLNRRYFVNGVGIGFDAFVNYQSTLVTRLNGQVKYLSFIVRSLSKYRSLDMEIRYYGTIHAGKTFLVAVGNGTSIGGGFRLTPDAKLNDGTFDVCRVADVGFGTILRHFPKLLNGHIGKVRQVQLGRSPVLQVSSAEPLPVHLDGEIYSMSATEINVKLAREKLRVIGNWADDAIT